MRSSLFAALLAAAGLAACGAAPRSAETLAESVRGFNDGVRWERFGAAATRVPTRERSQFVREMDERAEELKITDYEIVDVDARDAREARVQVKLSWYRTSEGTLRETHAVQTWERHGAAWIMVAEARVRGAEMPGLPDPVSPSLLGAGDRPDPPTLTPTPTPTPTPTRSRTPPRSR